MSLFWSEHPHIVEELVSVKNIMKKNINIRQKDFEKSLIELIDGPGKMLRPALCLTAGKFGEYNEERIHTLAASIETLHLATLIHDDIIDDSKLRRGINTIQHKYGKDFAVYMGDFLFCQCFMMLSKYDYDRNSLSDVANTISKICIGEISQYSFRYSMNLNIRRYLKIVSAKTAALFAISLYAGAKDANCEEKLAKNLARVGFYIGMAFQIIDDILDYTGHIEKIGKDPKNDIKKGYYTIPLIYGISRDKDGKIVSILNQDKINDAHIEIIINRVRENGGLDKAREVAVKYTNKALKWLDEIPDGENKELIIYIINKLLKREY